MESKDYLARRSLRGGFLDALGATTFGCLLTPAFASHLNGAQKAALCLFSMIMPILAMLRLQMSELRSDSNRDEEAELAATALVLRIVCVPLAVGMTLFIWGIWSVAAGFAVMSSVACVVVVQGRWKRRAGRLGMPSPELEA